VEALVVRPEADEGGGGRIGGGGERAFRRDGAYILDGHGAVVFAPPAPGQQIESGQALDGSRHFALLGSLPRGTGPHYQTGMSRFRRRAAMGPTFTSQHDGVNAPNADLGGATWSLNQIVGNREDIAADPNEIAVQAGNDLQKGCRGALSREQPIAQLDNDDRRLL
jgi:hypothetical protein